MGVQPAATCNIILIVELLNNFLFSIPIIKLKLLKIIILWESELIKKPEIRLEKLVKEIKVGLVD
jgi:hypothetical protein